LRRLFCVYLPFIA